ncbi:hypothetical protein SEVIR_2G300301v4 [Setaria viridis]|uniref:Uncharacterized protein n=2 Tax=Setaria TaxID=4554 RepID=A0A368Q4F5_SETIT|nr:hypothetical protein SETIT_2G289400v2 [Setaria italica]TKW34340.1 hypothetical protein SEVIR_2G300301v2 [Setaria viridis]
MEYTAPVPPAPGAPRPPRRQLPLRRHARRLAEHLDRYLTVAEYDAGEGMRRGDAYEQAQAYLAHRWPVRGPSARDSGPSVALCSAWAAARLRLPQLIRHRLTGWEG